MPPLSGTVELEVEAQRDGFLQIPFPGPGTKIGIEYIEASTGIRHPVPITVSPEKGMFYALFPEDNVDFELAIDNKASLFLDFAYNLGLQGRLHRFVQCCQTRGELNTFESFGRKFHFLSQKGEEGKTYVASVASDRGLSYEDAAVMVSRIKFDDLRYGTIVDCSGNETSKGKIIQVFVKTLRGNTIKLDVSSTEKVETVKKMIEDREGYPAADQRLMYTKFLLTDDHMLVCYQIGEGATLIMYGEGMKGGAKGQQVSRGSLILKPKSNNKISDIGKYNLGVLFAEDAGDPGVICFGCRSDQEFGLSHFIPSTFFKVKPFVIEVRMASRFKWL